MKIINSKMLITIIVVVVLAAIGLTLAKNKQKINSSNQPIDRTEVPVAVTVVKAELATMDIKNAYPAVVKPYEEANITSQTNGLISSLDIELGQQLRKGQTVGKLDTKLAALNLIAAEISLSKLEGDYRRAKELFENNAGMEINMINAKNAMDNAAIQVKLIKQQIANADIIAPISGTISAKNIKAGEFANPGAPIASITNINALKVTVFVDQSVIYTLHINQLGMVSSSLFSDKKLTGKVIYLSPKADQNHNYQVDLLLTNTNKLTLRAGTDVFVSFNAIKKSDVLQIPKAALVEDRQEPYVFVNVNGKAVGRTIKIGTIQNDRVEVISGLEAGETVITTGQINLSEGSNISVLEDN
jgi:RND family efflux transporter MFP subunit